MKFIDGIKYLFTSILIYLMIGFFEVYLLNPLVDFVSVDFKFHLMVYSICLLIVNPLIAWLILERISFKPSESQIKESISE